MAWGKSIYYPLGVVWFHQVQCNAFGKTLCFGGRKVKSRCSLKATSLTQNTKYTFHVYQSVAEMSLNV